MSSKKEQSITNKKKMVPTTTTTKNRTCENCGHMKLELSYMYSKNTTTEVVAIEMEREYTYFHS